MNQNCSTGLYTNSLSSHASLLLSATPTIISSPMQASSADATTAPASDRHHNNNQNNNNTNKTADATNTPTNATQNSPPLSPTPAYRPSLNPLYQRRANSQRQNPPAPIFSPSLACDSPPAHLVARTDLTQPITLANFAPSPVGYLARATMPNYINFKKPQNEIFKKLDGKIQKIVAAHSNLNKLYALNDFPGLGAATGPKRQPFELPAQLPRPPPWVPKCSTSDDGKHLEDPRNNTTTTYCSSSGASSPSCCSKEDLVHHFSKRPENSQANYKNQMVKKFLSETDTKRQSGPKASFILDAAISKLHQRHQEQKLKEHQQKRIGTTTTNTATTHTNSKLKLGVGPPSTHTVSVTHIRDISTVPRSNIASRTPSIAGSSSSLLFNNATPQPYTDSLSNADFTMLAEKIKETIDTQTFSVGKKTHRTPEEGRKYQEAIMSQFKEQLYSLTKSIRLKIPPPQPPASTTPSTPANFKEHKPILMKKSPQSLFKTIQRETSLLLNRPSQQNVRSSLSLLSDQQTYNRQNAHVKPATLTRTPPLYRPNSMRVVVPPTKAHYSLKFNNYLEVETPQTTAELMTIEEFAKGLNLVRSNDASLQKHQEQLMRSNSNWINSSSNRPLRLRRIRGEKIRMPVSASYKAARKIGLQ